MTPKLSLFVFCSLTAFLLCTENVKAGTKVCIYDSTVCCAPDSLRKLETDYPVFCVSWKVPSDSSCKTPQGFEIEWKRLTDSMWKHKAVTYSSGTYMTFCDSLYGCGIYQWRVRTKCTDSTYSNWVYGSKISVPCENAKIKTTDYSNPLKGANNSAAIKKRTPGTISEVSFFNHSYIMCKTQLPLKNFT